MTLPINLAQMLDQAAESTAGARSGRAWLETTVYDKLFSERSVVAMTFDTVFDHDTGAISISSTWSSMIGNSATEQRIFLPDGLIYRRSQSEVSETFAMLAGIGERHWVAQVLDDVLSPVARETLFAGYDPRPYAKIAHQAAVTAEVCPAAPGLIGIELAGLARDFAVARSEQDLEAAGAAWVRLEIDPAAGRVNAISARLPLADGGRIELRLAFYGLGRPVLIERPPEADTIPPLPVIAGHLTSINTSVMAELTLQLEGRELKTAFDIEGEYCDPDWVRPKTGESVSIDGWTDDSGVLLAVAVTSDRGVIYEAESDDPELHLGEERVAGEARVTDMGVEHKFHLLRFVGDDGEEYGGHCPEEIFEAAQPRVGESVELHRHWLEGQARLWFARRPDGVIIAGEDPAQLEH